MEQFKNLRDITNIRYFEVKNGIRQEYVLFFEFMYV